MPKINDDDDYDIVEPSAAAMIESMRAIGYTPETAVADLIDNSIAAGARNVWLQFQWDGAGSHVAMTDDGAGMTEKFLVNAMRPGSQNPLKERSAKDLGRFGLGLKTASFSQCRRLTVASKSTGKGIAVRRWDLDYVKKHDKWRLLRSASEGSERHFAHLKKMSHGTVVLWECMDRVVGNSRRDNRNTENQFLDLIRIIEEHLAMVFHRFLSRSGKKLQIYINGRNAKNRIKPWDPFLEGHEATHKTPIERIPCGNDKVRVRGYVLPHQDRLGELHRAASGPAGWNAQQGFYVYRNDRLLVSGSWLGLGPTRSWTKEEHYKLARICLDIPNTLDSEWQIDVKKSTATPPGPLRVRLRELASSVRKDARAVFAHRGAFGPREKREITGRAWKSLKKQGRQTYRIDRKHVLVSEVFQSVRRERKIVETMLRVIEETVPIEQVWLDTADNPDARPQPFELAPESEVRGVIQDVYRALRNVEGLTAREAHERLAHMEAFQGFDAIIATLKDAEVMKG